jgi:hypothetical protein
LHVVEELFVVAVRFIFADVVDDFDEKLLVEVLNLLVIRRVWRVRD